MRKLVFIATGVACAIAGLSSPAGARDIWVSKPAHAEKLPTVEGIISVADQEFRLIIGGKLIHVWKTSTVDPNATGCTVGGVIGAAPTPCKTPIGSFTPTRIAEKELSPKWKSWMYYPVYIDNEGDAIHGIDDPKELALLGQAASHGCGRLTPDEAFIFYTEVKKRQRGKSFPGVRIIIQEASFKV